ncbi:cell division protein FtsL [Thalassobacillus devorans]|uniref:Cell division protein FtsL n=1 Tax=Thalassobacillus devorans TaxID=279813 RepID=A0ABQ1NRA5_9BACI|nr:cell division protein FtsL [Thalassobacillus devorans]NIK27807.1 cell division protein FtsL [Thalassobacillus devorans]GGC80590.1 cell division protein FtsL [Thalassobacillus devorans]
MNAEQIKHMQQPEEQQQKQVKVKVQKKRWISRGEKFLYTAVSGIVLTASVFMVQFSSTTDALNRDVQKLEQHVKVQKAENESLQYEVKELSNPDRILKIAKENGLNIQNAQVKQASTIGN